MRRAYLYALTMACLMGPAHGQRLYRKEMDAAAQQAVKAMEKVGSKDLFDSMLANLSTQSKQDFDTVFSGIQRQTRDRIQTWDNWCAVHNDMVQSMERLGYTGLQTVDLFSSASASDLKSRCARLLQRGSPPDEVVSAEWRRALADIKTAKDALDRELDSLKKPPDTPEPRVLALVGQLGNLSEVADALQQIQESPSGGKLQKLAAPAAEAAGIVKQLSAAYQDYKSRREQIQNVRQQLRELRAEMLKVAVLKLAAQEEHLNRLIAIEARRIRELEDAVAAFEDYRSAILCERQQDPDLDLKRIDDSLREAGLRVVSDTSTSADAYLYSAALGKALTPEAAFLRFCQARPAPPRLRLARLARALFQAATVEARAGTPVYLAELRRAQENQRYSIVQSSLEARAYETLVNTGVQRLAMLHAGGIKPEQIAQLVFQAGQLTGVSLIASQQ